MEKMITYSILYDRVIAVFQFFLLGFLLLGFGLSLIGVFGSEAFLTTYIIPNIYAISGSLRFWFTEAVFGVESLRALLICLGISFSLTALMAIMINIEIRKIFKNMKNGRPFDLVMPRRIRKIATVIFIYALLNPMIEMALNVFANPSTITNVEQAHLVYNFDVSTLFLGFVVMLVSFVFEYGAQLQKQSDETL